MYILKQYVAKNDYQKNMLLQSDNIFMKSESNLFDS